MKPELQDILQHHGVKGMKWGKHMKSAGSKVGEKTKEVAGKVTSKVKPHIDSIKRENSWKKQLNNASSMSTKAIQKVASRAQLENDLKKLSKKGNIGSTKDKKDYLKRAGMTDQELFRKVQRLRAKDSLNRNADEATKKQKEIAKKVMQIATPIVVSYAMSGSISKKDIFNAVINPGGAKAKVIKSVVDSVAKKAKHSVDLDDVLLHSLLDESDMLLQDFDAVLQHHGVKGMRWGKHLKSIKARGAARKERIKSDADTVRRRKKGEITRKQANDERWKSFHKEQSNNKHYKNEYDRRKAKGQEDKKAMRGAYQVAQARKKATNALVAKAAVAGLAVGKVGFKVGKDIASNPDNIRKAKNVVQAMKRSPIRYVDGKKMKNVINFN